MMLDNCSYNKIKVLHELSALAWFIQKHALHDAKAAGDSVCIELFQELDDDIQRHLERLRQNLCIVSQ